jgi:phosphotransferase system enzyme I (PtsI)
LPKLIGIAASPGVAIGKVHPIDRRRARVPRYHIAADDVPHELERLDHAIRDSVEQLQAIRESLGEGDQGKILDAHRMMADDPSVLDSARSLVREELLNAEWAVRRTFREISEKLGNDLAERRADLDEVSDRIIHNLVGEVPATQLEQPPQDSILVAYDLPTAEAAVLLSGGRVKGLVTDFGSKTSHTAILARALEVPAVVGAGQASEICRAGDLIALDGNTGEVLISPDAEEVLRFEVARAEGKLRDAALLEERDLPAVTLDGRRVGLWANIEFPEEVPSLLAHGGEGVGLYRTEFLYLNREELPTEEEHFNAYASILRQMGDRPVVIRTLDLGGDKLPIGHRSHEPNPALGLRAIRFTLRHPQLFRTQVRAIWRASTLGRLRIMLPMIAAVGELREAKAQI